MFEHWPQQSPNDRPDDSAAFYPQEMRDIDHHDILEQSERVANLVEACMETMTETELSWYEGETDSTDIARMVKAIKPDNRGLFDDAEIGRIYRHRIMQKVCAHVQRRLAAGCRDDQVFEVFA